MTIEAKDIKLLWGKAAGICSAPGCDERCFKHIANKDFLIGEMAHVIAQSARGPRGKATASGIDIYENLILLCPNHHKLIDKAPEQFPEKTLQQWKEAHEARISFALTGPILSDLGEVKKYISQLLIENKSIWATYGPESDIAKTNPYSNAVLIWQLRKLDTIIPNNTRIVGVLAANEGLLNKAEFAAYQEFLRHAEGFAMNCHSRIDDVPRFPLIFASLLGNIDV